MLAEECLQDERAIYTYPAINSSLFKRVYGIILNETISKFVTKVYAFYINLTTAKYLGGGVILYDYNFLKDQKVDKNLISQFKKEREKKLIFANRLNNTEFEITISPFSSLIVFRIMCQ